MKWEECIHMKKTPRGKRKLLWCSYGRTKHQPCLWLVDGEDSGNNCDSCKNKTPRNK